MTIWMPELRGRAGPKYQAIVDAIVDAVNSGDLSPGTKLPPQRNLAYDLGVTLGTVTRAYQELERSGLARGEVGRGTFITVPTDRAAPAPSLNDNIDALRMSVDQVPSPYNSLYGTDFMGSEGLELASNYPLTGGVGALTQRAVARINHEAVWDAVSRYQAHNGLRPHLEAGAQWLNGIGVEAKPEDLLIAPGGQAATQIALMALAQPGDLIVAEALSWPGVKVTAAPLGLRVEGLAMDDQGLVPDAFEQACRDRAPRLLYLLPTLQNPTTSIMPEERRRQIAEIARKYGVFIVEDDVYGFLLGQVPLPVHSIAPDITVYVTSLSKAVSPGLRVGYLLVPTDRMASFVGALRSSTLMASPITVEIASEMIRGGEADEMMARQRREVESRQQELARRLGHLKPRTHPRSLHAWMPVPSGFTGPEFRTQLLERGVSVTPGNAFVMDERHRPEHPHVRICLGAEQDRQRLDRALAIIAEVAAGSGAQAMTTYV
jgi:DNA-binding transcriptional MocR family regulator